MYVSGLDSYYVIKWYVLDSFAFYVEATLGRYIVSEVPAEKGCVMLAAVLDGGTP